MSDEPNPPSLRLKPRQSPASATPAAPVSSSAPSVPVAPVPMTPVPVGEAPVVEAAAQTGGESDLLRLRLKPKTPAPEAPTISFATPVPFSTPPVVVPENIRPAPAIAASLPPVVDRPVVVPPPPLVTPPPVTLKKPPYVPTPRNLAEPVAMRQESSAPPVIKADKLLAGIVLVVLVVVGVVYGISKSRSKAQAAKDSPPVAAAAAKPASVPPPAPSPPKLVDKPVSAAGKAIATARDVVADIDKREKEQGVDSVIEETPAVATATSPIRAVPAKAAEPLVPAAPVEPPPAEPFKQFVVNMRVNGVFQGDNARAMLNGKMVHPGDVVNDKLAITLLKIDVDSKQLIFRDDTGATVIRRY